MDHIKMPQKMNLEMMMVSIGQKQVMESGANFHLHKGNESSFEDAPLTWWTP